VSESDVVVEEADGGAVVAADPMQEGGLRLVERK
jgi:hypothetical protein